MPENIISKIQKLSVKMRIFRTRIGGDSETAKLNDRQLLMLEMLAEQKQISVKDIGQCFKGVGQSTISMDLKLLRTKHWIQKTFSPTDDRIHLSELTNEGKKKVEEIHRRAIAAYLPLAKAIGKNQKELNVLNKIIDRIINEVDSKLADSVTNTD